MAQTFAQNAGDKDVIAFTEGNLVFADLDENGIAGDEFTEVGSLTEFSFSQSFVENEIKETRSGFGNITENFITDKQVEVTLTIQSITAYNLRNAMLGELTENTGGVSATVERSVKGGKTYLLSNEMIDRSTIVVADDATTPTVTYELGKNYDLDNTGLLKILPEAIQTARGAATVLPDATPTTVFATFTTVDSSKIQAFKVNTIKKYAVFGGINKVDGKFYKIVVPEFSINPSDTLPFLSPDANQTITITAKALFSSVYPDQSPFDYTLQK